MTKMIDRSVSILIVENDMATSQEIMSVLGGVYHCTFAKSFAEAADALSETAFNLVVLSLALSENAEQSLFEVIRKNRNSAHVIALSEPDDIRGQATALKQGALYTIEKPLKTDRFLVLVKSALRSYELIRNRAHAEDESVFAKMASVPANRRVA